MCPNVVEVSVNESENIVGSVSKMSGMPSLSSSGSVSSGIPSPSLSLPIRSIAKNTFGWIELIPVFRRMISERRVSKKSGEKINICDKTSLS